MTHNNIVGFKNKAIEYSDYLHCVVHIGTPLITDPRDPDSLICPECGTPYQEDELKHETGPQSKFGNPSRNTGPKLFQSSRKKTKLIAEDGSEIPEDDQVAMMDLAVGNKILSYRED